MVDDLIKKIYIRGSGIYLRDVSKITEKGFYQFNNTLIANGQIIDEWTDWCNLVQQEITVRRRNKKINQILNER